MFSQQTSAKTLGWSVESEFEVAAKTATTTTTTTTTLTNATRETSPCVFQIWTFSFPVLVLSPTTKATAVATKAFTSNAVCSLDFRWLDTKDVDTETDTIKQTKAITWTTNKLVLKSSSLLTECEKRLDKWYCSQLVVGFSLQQHREQFEFTLLH